MPFTGTKQYHGKVKVDVAQSTAIQKILGIVGEDKAVSGGVCMGYSAQWISKGAQGKDFWKWLDSSEATATLLQMGHRESTTMTVLLTAFDKWGRRDKSKISDEMLEKLVTEQETWAKQHVTRTTGLAADPRVKGAYDPFEIGPKLVESDGFKLLDAMGASKLGHAMAVSVSGNKVVFMDPNFGEVHFEDKWEFAAWLATEHLVKYKDDKFTEFTIDSFPAAVHPSEVSGSYTRSAAAAALPSGTTSASAQAAEPVDVATPVTPAPAPAPPPAWKRATPTAAAAAATASISSTSSSSSPATGADGGQG